MNFNEELKAGVKTEIETRDLVKESGISDMEVPANLGPIKARVEGVLNFRNENQRLDPNMFELMAIMTGLNNDLARDKNASLEQRESLKHAFSVLYDNVINDGFIGNHLGDKNSNIYKMFETVKKSLDNPQKIDAFTAEYLRVLSGVNLFQRQQIRNKKGNILGPNELEQAIIESIEREEIPENLKEITLEVQKDIENPEKMIDKNIGIE